MSCIACEKYEKRITNVFRDEELKEKFEKLIGYPILTDCFTCDNCTERLQEALEFQENCIKIYKKNNPNYHDFEKLPNQQTAETEDKQNEYVILEANDELFTNEEQLEGQNQLINEEFTIYEINGSGKQIQIEQSVEKKSPKKPTRLKSEGISCIVMEKDLENEDEFMVNEELVSNITDDQATVSYRIESLDDSQGHKKPRKSYSVQQKLEIIEFAEKFTNREAARKFDLNESTIRCFRRQKDMLQGMDPNKSTKRHGTPYWPELETHLKEWAEKQPVKPKMQQVKEEAVKIAKNLGYDNFSGSNTYIFKFMQRNHIEAASPRPRKKLKVEQDSELPNE